LLFDVSPIFYELPVVTYTIGWYIRGLFVKFVDKYNVIKSTTILIKCISIEIYTPIQSKSPNNVSTLKRF